MNFLKLLLYPLAALYNGVMRMRNHLYDIGQKPSFYFETAVIAVGNLNVGGTGKTPMVEYLIALLSGKLPTVILSRGYKRETSGYRVAGKEDNARSIGDEPLQLYRKFGDKVRVVVGEDRVYAIPHILHEFPETKVLLLDDAMQQRSILPHMTILLTGYEKPFYQDFVLPFGRLRESRKGSARADVVVVTKCEQGLADDEREKITKSVQRFAGPKPVFFAHLTYGEPRAVKAGTKFSDNVILVSGIANAKPLLSFCTESFTLLRHFKFADHHRYKLADLQEIDRYCAAQGGAFSILTTEKDLVKLDVSEFSSFFERWNWFSLPIQHAFARDGAKFDSLVLAALSRPSSDQ